MPKFEGNYSRESYDKTQEDEANLKQQIGNAKSADEMIEIATKLKEIESNKQELHDAAYDEAVAENQAKMQRGELKESGSEKTMYEEAENENKEFEKAKNINQLEETSKNLKEQLNQAKSADEMMEIAKQLKEIEEKKKEIDGGSQKKETGEKITTIEELKSKDSEDTTKKIKEIRKKLNGEKYAEKTVENAASEKLEKKENKRTTEERLNSLKKAFEEMPEIKPGKDDLEKYNKYLEEIKLEKSGKITGLYNRLQSTYEYVKKVAENPKFAQEMRNFFIEQLKQKGLNNLVDAYESGNIKIDDEIEVERAKLTYVDFNGQAQPYGAVSAYYTKGYIGSCMDIDNSMKEKMLSYGILIPLEEKLIKDRIRNDETKEKIEDIYGMNKEEMHKLLDSRGFLDEEVKSNNPEFEKKIEEFNEKKKAYDQLRVKLFDKVLSEKASEEEIKIAEEHVTKLAKEFNLDGFHGIIPHSWYSNERLLNAMASSSKSNEQWVKDVMNRNYTKDELMKKGFEKIGEDGFKHTYAEE